MTVSWPPYATDERDLAIRHMERLTKPGLTGSLLLPDRWYPSRAFIAQTLNMRFSFVMRVREKWNLEVDQIKTQGKVTISQKGRVFTVRVLKIRLSSGETETLLTNLNQKQLPIRNPGELYFKRWGVETAYDALKSKLQPENFSGKTVVSVYQDFYATCIPPALPPPAPRTQTSTSPHTMRRNNSNIPENPVKTVQFPNCGNNSGSYSWNQATPCVPVCRNVFA